jgi:hypothetical protein
MRSWCHAALKVETAQSIVESRFSPAFVSSNAMSVVSATDATRCCRAFSQASVHLGLSALDRCERTDLASANGPDPAITHVQPGAEQI